VPTSPDRTIDNRQSGTQLEDGQHLAEQHGTMHGLPRPVTVLAAKLAVAVVHAPHPSDRTAAVAERPL
jgi:hypothetical protein